MARTSAQTRATRPVPQRQRLPAYHGALLKEEPMSKPAATPPPRGIPRREPRGLAVAARQGAIKELLALHRDEYDELHRRQRAARGLQEEFVGGRRRKTDLLREQLRALGVDPVA